MNRRSFVALGVGAAIAPFVPLPEPVRQLPDGPLMFGGSGNYPPYHQVSPEKLEKIGKGLEREVAQPTGIIYAGTFSKLCLDDGTEISPSDPRFWKILEPAIRPDDLQKLRSLIL